jgi:hypothetical protein
MLFTLEGRVLSYEMYRLRGIGRDADEVEGSASRR